MNTKPVCPPLGCLQRSPQLAKQRCRPARAAPGDHLRLRGRLRQPGGPLQQLLAGVDPHRAAVLCHWASEPSRGLPHTARQSYKVLRQGEALLELDVNAHDSSDPYVSGHVKKRVHSPLSMGLTAWRERKSAVK